MGVKALRTACCGLGLALLLTLSACGSPGWTEAERALLPDAPAQSHTLQRQIALPLPEAPRDWSLTFPLSEVEDFLYPQVYEGLVDFSPEGRLRLLQAEAIEEVDAKTYRIHLRPDLAWSDGSPILAEDYRQSYLIRLKQYSQADCAPLFLIEGGEAYHAGQISEEALGLQAEGRTLTLRFRQALPHATAWLSDPSFYAFKQSAEGHPLFSGAYQPDPQAQTLRLIRNPHYWDYDHLEIHQIDLPIEPDAIAAYEGYRSGLYVAMGDPFYPIPKDRREAAHQLPDAQSHLTSRLAYLRVDPEAHPLLAQAENREALYQVLDPLFLSQAILFDGSRPFPDRPRPSSAEIARLRSHFEALPAATVEAYKEAPLTGLAGPDLLRYRLLVASTKEWLSLLRLHLRLKRLPDTAVKPAVIYEECRIPTGDPRDWAVLLFDEAPESEDDSPPDWASLPRDKALLPLLQRASLSLISPRLHGFYVSKTGHSRLADCLCYQRVTRP